MSTVTVTCGVDGCGEKFQVTGRQAKAVLAKHRKEKHPDWEPQELPPPDPYRMDYWR